MQQSPLSSASSGSYIEWQPLGVIDNRLPYFISSDPLTSTAVSLAGSTSSLDSNPGTRGLRNEDIRYEKTNPLDLTNFRFNVSGTIVGVELEVQAQRNSRILDDTIVLIHDGSVLGKNQRLSLDQDEFEHWPNHPNTVLYGGSTNTWGAQLTAQIINSNSFGVRLVYSSNLWQPHRDRMLLDSVRLKVYTQ